MILAIKICTNRFKREIEIIDWILDEDNPVFVVAEGGGDPFTAIEQSVHKIWIFSIFEPLPLATMILMESWQISL